MTTLAIDIASTILVEGFEIGSAGEWSSQVP